MRKSNFIFLFLLLIASAAWSDNAPPPKKKLTLQDLLKASSGSSKSSRSTTVAGVRGLDETSGTVDTKARDFAAIDRLEKLPIHEDDVTRFIEEGKLK